MTESEQGPVTPGTFSQESLQIKSLTSTTARAAALGACTGTFR